MPVTISGSGTITGIATGGLPDGSIAAGDLASSLDLTGKTVTLPSGTGGKILQVKQTYKQDTFTTTSTSFTDVTGLSVAITPASADNHILVCAYFVLANTNTGGNYYSAARLMRGSTQVFNGTASGSRPAATVYSNQSDDTIAYVTGFTYRDSPATTDEVTYKIQIKSEGSGTACIGRTPQDADTSNHARMPANIVVMEVAG